MSSELPYGKASRMLTLAELCAWLNITERHARKLVERNAIPYRKVGRLLRFPEAEIEEWSHPIPKEKEEEIVADTRPLKRKALRKSARLTLPKSLIE